MLCGPGAIANAIVLMQDAHTIEMKSTLIGMIALIYFITFLILRASTRLVKILGETGNNALNGIDIDGNCCRVFCQRSETDFGRNIKRGDDVIKQTL